MNYRTFVTTLSFSLLALSSSSALAENPTRGRLPDGRAFRTDAQGIQLADYTAELELSIEEQNRRIMELEDQLSRKESMLNRKTAAPSPKLIERTLVASPSECPAAPVCDTVAPQKVAMLTTKLEASEKLNAELERELINAKEEGGKSQQVWKKNEVALKEKVEKLEERLSELRADLRKTGEKLEVAEEKISQHNAKMTSRRESSRADAMRASYRASNQAAITAQKSAVRTKLNALRGLAQTRAASFQKYDALSQKSVSFKLSPLKHRFGKDLTALQAALNSAQTQGQVSSVRGEVNKLRNILSDDIALLRRVTRNQSR